MNVIDPSFLEPLPQLLSQIFGSKATSASYQVLNQHDDYCVLALQMEPTTSEVIVKLAGHISTMGADFGRTALIHTLLRAHTDIPVAEIVAVDTSYAHFPWRYLIQKRLRGRLWAEIAPQLDAKQKYSASTQIGHALAQLHGITFPAFGEIDSDAQNIAFVDALLRRSQRTIQHQHARDRFANVLGDRSTLFESIVLPALCHDDLHHYNVLFEFVHDRWELTGILDFDKAWAGHAEIDLARLDFWDNMQDKGIKDGYTTIREIASGYEQRRMIYQLMWCLEYARPTARHSADLTHLCDALGIAPIMMG